MVNLEIKSTSAESFHMNEEDFGAFQINGEMALLQLKDRFYRFAQRANLFDTFSADHVFSAIEQNVKHDPSGERYTSLVNSYTEAYGIDVSDREVENGTIIFRIPYKSSQTRREMEHILVIYDTNGITIDIEGLREAIKPGEYCTHCENFLQRIIDFTQQPIEIGSAWAARTQQANERVLRTNKPYNHFLPNRRTTARGPGRYGKRK